MKTFLPVCWSKRLLPTVGLLAFAVSNSHGLTVITNDGFTGNNTLIASNYGSNASDFNTSTNWSISAGLSGVVGTPDIALAWSGGDVRFDTYTNWDGRGNVVQLDSKNKTSHVFNIAFTPSETTAVNITSFVLDAWSGATGGIDIVANWSLTNADGSQTYSSGTFTMPAGSGGRSTITTNYTGLVGQSLVLRIDQIAGARDFFAFDDLTFDQILAVPEPSTFACFVAGLATMVVIVRRRRHMSERGIS